MRYTRQFDYDYEYKVCDAKGLEIDDKAYTLSNMEKAELAARFRCLRWKRWHRIFTSMKKFVQQVCNFLPFIYADDECEKLFEDLMWVTEKRGYQKKFIKPIRRIEVVDGFINEGKSTDLLTTTGPIFNGFDSEFSDFFRAKLRKYGGEGPDFLPDKYYPIFIVCGIASSINHTYEENKTTLVLDRAWGSVELFCQNGFIIGHENQPTSRAMNPLDYNFYMSLFGLATNLPAKSWLWGRAAATLNISLYSRLGFDTTWPKKRGLEEVLYGADSSRSLLFHQLAYNFLFSLDNIYKDDKECIIEYNYNQRDTVAVPEKLKAFINKYGIWFNFAHDILKLKQDFFDKYCQEICH